MLSPDQNRRILVLKRDDAQGRKGGGEHAVEGVYDRIKGLLLAHALAPGQLLQIGTLAEELGVSTTPVREALTRLAAERLIVFAPKRGFFAKTASEEELRGLYTLNQTLLDCALQQWPAESAAMPGASGEPPHSPLELARASADLFVRIATRSAMGELVDIVRNFNDRLHHARMIEVEIIEEAPTEWLQLHDAYRSDDREQLAQVLQGYHLRRRERVSAICKELLFRPFLADKS